MAAKQPQPQTLSLPQVFGEHKVRQGRILELRDQLQSAYSKLDQISQHATGQENRPDTLSSLLLDKDELHQIDMTLNQPSIMIAGQLNAGKSFLINEIVGKSVLERSETACTGRIVELKYGPKTKIRIVDKDGKVENIHTEGNETHVPRGIANPTVDQRFKDDIISSKVIAEFNLPVLESGVCFLDLPGFDENTQLRELMETHVTSVLPIIVYVIDATRRFTNVDREQLQRLYKHVPQKSVYFVVSKMDLLREAEADKSPDESTSDEEDETQTSSPYKKDQQGETFRDMDPQTTREVIYKSLVDNQFLEGVPIEECSHYHTLSSWDVHMARKGGKNIPEPFDCFQSSLVKFIKQRLENATKECVQLLQSSISTCLHFYVKMSGQEMTHQSDMDNCFDQMIRQEQSLHSMVTSKIQESAAAFPKTVKKSLKLCKENLRAQIREIKFEELEIDVPEDGFIDAAKTEQVKKKVREVVLREMGHTIHQDLLRKMGPVDMLCANIERLVIKFEYGTGQQTDLLPTLNRRFVNHYHMRTRDVSLTKSLWKWIKSILHRLLVLTCLSVDRLDVHSPIWKNKIIDEIYSSVNADDVANELLKGIKEHIEEGHRKFMERLEEARTLAARQRALTEERRSNIREEAYKFGSLLLRARDLFDRLIYPDLQLCYGQRRGFGAEGMVFNSDILGPNGEKTAVKIVPVKTVDPGTRMDHISKLGIEIHFTRELDHPNILPIFATILLEGDNCLDLQILMPRMKCDLSTALKQGALPTLRMRLEKAVQLAKAVEYMHSKKILHRDIKIDNVLLSENDTVKLCDFGFCKAICLTSGSQVGTTVNMAPEITQERRHCTGSDVFAFGCLLEQLCKDKGARSSKNLSAAKKLSENCREPDSISRPSIKTVLEELERIVDAEADGQSEGGREALFDIDNIPVETAISAKQ